MLIFPSPVFSPFQVRVEPFPVPVIWFVVPGSFSENGFHFGRENYGNDEQENDDTTEGSQKFLEHSISAFLYELLPPSHCCGYGGSFLVHRSN